jgi:hypothetical protein
MNLTQWLMILVPVVLAYGVFVVLGKTNGRKSIPLNAAVGLLLIPILFAVMPFIMVGAAADLVRKRVWRDATVVLVLALVVAGYAALVFHLRDRPTPISNDLPLER